MIGRGLLVTLELPDLLPFGDAVFQGNALNLAGRDRPYRIPSLGAWSIRPKSKERASIAWSSFVPAVELARLAVAYQGKGVVGFEAKYGRRYSSSVPSRQDCAIVQNVKTYRKTKILIRRFRPNRNGYRLAGEIKDAQS